MWQVTGARWQLKGDRLNMLFCVLVLVLVILSVDVKRFGVTVMLDFSDEIIFPHFWTVALHFASKTVQAMEHIGILLMPTKSGKMINQYIWSRPKKLPWLALSVTYPPHLCTIHSNFLFPLLYIAKTSEPIIICQNNCQVRIYWGGNDQ